ncbi:hypothetical protein Tco_0046642 [Tanacetum coccineum]
MATTNIFEVNHEDAYDSDVDEGPNAAAAFMANLSSISGTNGVTTRLVNEFKMFQLRYPSGHTVVSMITILDDLRTQLDGHLKVNQEQCLVNDSLRAELAKCKLEIVRLDTQQVKLDLERQVRQEQNLVTQRNARNAELEQEKVMLKIHLKSKDVSIEFLKSENQKVLTDKKKLEDKYLDEIKPKNASQDLHKDILGRSNPRYGKKAPVINASNMWDTDETLASAEVSMAKMKGKPGHVRPASGFYEKLNAMMFVPQEELSREQVYWLPASKLLVKASTQPNLLSPYVT